MTPSTRHWASVACFTPNSALNRRLVRARGYLLNRDYPVGEGIAIERAETRESALSAAGRDSEGPYLVGLRNVI